MSKLFEMMKNKEIPFFYLGKEEFKIIDKIDPTRHIRKYNELFENTDALLERLKPIFDKKINDFNLELTNVYFIVPDFLRGLSFTNHMDFIYCKLNEYTYGDMLVGEFVVTENDKEILRATKEICLVPKLTDHDSIIINGTEDVLTETFIKSRDIYVGYTQNPLNKKYDITYNLVNYLGGDLNKLAISIYSNGRVYIEFGDQIIETPNIAHYLNLDKSQLNCSGSIDQVLINHLDKYVKSYPLTEVQINNIEFITGNRYESLDSNALSSLVKNLIHINQTGEALYKLDIKALPYKEFISSKKYIMDGLVSTLRDACRFRTEEQIRNISFINERSISKKFLKIFHDDNRVNFLDSVNPVSELSNKRRVNMGVKSGDRPSKEDRQYHETFNNTICPIETPEGNKIGLSLNYALGYDNKEYSSEATLVGLPCSLIPFLQNNDANRCLMASNMLKQALSLENPANSKVVTEMYKQLPEVHWLTVKAEKSGRVSRIKDQVLTVENDDNTISIYKCNKYDITNYHTNYESSWCVSEGDKIREGQILNQSKFFNKGYYTTGTNLLIGYMPYKGLNYEDSLVISESAAKKLTASLIYELSYEFDGKEVVLPDFRFLNDYKLNMDYEFDQDHMISLINSYQKKGTYLFHKCVQNYNILNKNLGKDAIYKVREIKLDRDAFIIDIFVKIRKSGHDDRTISLRNYNKEDGKIIRLDILYRYSHPIEVGDKLSGRAGNKGIVCKILPDKEMPRLPDGRHLEIILNTLGIPSRMNIGQLFDAWLGLASETIKNQLIVNRFSQLNEENKEFLNKLIDKLIELIKPENTYLEDLRFLVNNYYEEVIDLLIDEVVFMTPTFDDFSIDNIQELFKFLGLPESGSDYLTLSDGRKTLNKVSYGVSTVLRLKHIVVDKFKTRCIGFDDRFLNKQGYHKGQKLGEMELWSLESHNANNFLHEIINVISDNDKLRRSLYLDLTNGNNNELYTRYNSKFDTLKVYLQGLNMKVSVEDAK